MENQKEKKLPPQKIAGQIIESLRGLVAPSVGIPFILVGRKRETETFLDTMEYISDGNAAFRFIVGSNGAGKSMMLQAVRNKAIDTGFVTVNTDLSPSASLFGDASLSTYKKLMTSLSTKGARGAAVLEAIIGKVIEKAQENAKSELGKNGNSGNYDDMTLTELNKLLEIVNEQENGPNYCDLIKTYYLAGDKKTKDNVIRWIRGEFDNKTDARSALRISKTDLNDKQKNISGVIGKDNWYQYLKLFALLVKCAGYKGLLVMFDEAAGLLDMNASSRTKNYNTILTMYNEMNTGGNAKYIGVIMCATPEALYDTEKGFSSVNALRQRIEKPSGDSSISSGPVISLNPLTDEEMAVLCENINNIYSVSPGGSSSPSREEIKKFLSRPMLNVHAGNCTPREVIRDYINELDRMNQTDPSETDDTN